MPKALGPGNTDPARHTLRHDPLSREGRAASQPPRIGSGNPGTLFPGDRPTLPPPPGMMGGPSEHFGPPPPSPRPAQATLADPARLPDPDPALDAPPSSPRPRFASLPGGSPPPSSPRPGFDSLPPAPRPQGPFDPVRDALGQSHPDPRPFGIAGGGRILPPLDFGPPAPPPNPFLERVNADWNRNHADLPPKHTRVGFAGPGGERIPAGAQTPPPQPPPTWNGTRNTQLSDMVAANYDTVHAERRDQRQFFDDIAANPMSDTATKRRELREELARIDRDPNSQHLGQAAREDLAALGMRRPELVDEAWLAPTRPGSPASPPSPPAA